MTLSILLWVPLALSLLAALLPARLAGRAAVIWSLITVGIAISFVARFQTGAPGLQFRTDQVWISALGIHYKLGLDGLNVSLVLVATIIFAAAILWASFREWDRPAPSSSCSAWPRAASSAPSAPRTWPCLWPSLT